LRFAASCEEIRSLGRVDISWSVRWNPPGTKLWLFTSTPLGNPLFGGPTSDEGGEKMGIIGWIILGLLAGVIAKLVLPGDDPGGIIVTTLIGIAGAFIGGLIAKALGFGDPIDEFFDLSTWLGAIIGSIILLLGYRLIAGRRDRGLRGRLT